MAMGCVRGEVGLVEEVMEENRRMRCGKIWS